MRQGIADLPALIEEVHRQKKMKRDFLADSKLMTVDDELTLDIGMDGQRFEMNDNFHDQTASALQIPRKFYDLLREKHPRLLAVNINHLFKAKHEIQFVRTLDGKARALLSNRYRPLDNSLIMEAALTALHGTDMEVESSQITEKHLYLKVVFPGMEMSVDKVAKELILKNAKIMGGRAALDIHPRDYWEIEKLSPGLIISNSETGHGAVKIESLVYTLRCKNGAIFTGALRKFHVGKELGGEDGGSREYLSDAAKKAEDRAFVMKVHDLTKAACDPLIFQNHVAKIAVASNQIIENVQGVCQKTQEVLDLRDDERDGILEYLAKGGDLSRWGLSSAITRYSQDVENYERATELERLGGRIIELPPQEWASLVSEN